MGVLEIFPAQENAPALCRTRRPRCRQASPRPFPRPRHRGRAVAAPPLCTVDIRLGRSQIVQDEAVASVLTPATRAQSSGTRES